MHECLLCKRDMKVSNDVFGNGCVRNIYSFLDLQMPRKINLREKTLYKSIMRINKVNSLNKNQKIWLTDRYLTYQYLNRIPYGNYNTIKNQINYDIRNIKQIEKDEEPKSAKNMSLKQAYDLYKKVMKFQDGIDKISKGNFTDEDSIKSIITSISFIFNMSKNKKQLFICIIILVSIFVIGSIIFYILQKNDFSNYMIIKTQESCYKVNAYGKAKKIDSNEFAEANNKIYSITNCFESYIDRDKNEVLNKINQENCNLFLEDNKDTELLNIINEIANLKHDLFDVKIICTEKDNYYVSVYLNTNWICPSDLYIYDKNEKKLKLIFETCNETILDVNENNFIY